MLGCAYLAIGEERAALTELTIVNQLDNFSPLIDENDFREKSVWKEPKPVLIQDEAVGRIVNGHKGNVEFSITYLVPPKVRVDKHSISGKLIFRACDNQICTLPQELPFHTDILVTKK